MAIRGDLTMMSMPQLFTLLARTKREGTLTVTDGMNSRIVHFGGGAIRLLSVAGGRPVRLVELLQRDRRVTSERLDTALRIQKDTGTPLPQVLEQMGVVNAAELKSLILKVTRDEIYDLFRWPKGSFDFEEGQAPRELTVVRSRVTELALDLESFLLDALRSADEKVRDTERMESRSVATPHEAMIPPGKAPGVA